MILETFLQGMTIVETVLCKQMTKQQIDIYFKLLEDIPDKNFVSGITRLMQERVYTNIPSPAEIRNYCLENRENDLLVRASEAKIKLKNALCQIGIYETVAFDDPVLHLLIRDLGGWCKVGTMPEKAFEDFMKFKFEKLYIAYATRQNTNIPTKFYGINHSENIVYIGNEQKAIAWITNYVSKRGQDNIETKADVTNSLLEGKGGITCLVKS